MQTAAEPEFYPAAGKRLGRYELILRLARGGMAEVWLAKQRGELGFTRVVALKVIRPEYADQPSFRAMFLDEARIAARLHHANVVEVVDLGEHERVLYLAMAYVEGDSLLGLRDRLREQSSEPPRFEVGMAVRIVSDVCAGVHAAHELLDEDGRPLDLVHRDISPHNILVGLDGVARLSDFGIAKILGRLSEKTETGQVKGKLSYLSPEQTRRLPADRRSDLFSAGIVLWELITGARLFRADDEATTLLNVTNKAVPDPRTLVELPDTVAEVVLKALARDPKDRYQTGDEMRRALEQAAKSAALIASAKDVADFVSDLVLADVEGRRAALRADERASRTSIPAPLVASPYEPTVRPGKTPAAPLRPEDPSTSTVDVARISASTPGVAMPLLRSKRPALWLVAALVPLAAAAAYLASRPSEPPTAPVGVAGTTDSAKRTPPTPIVAPATVQGSAEPASSASAPPSVSARNPPVAGKGSGAAPPTVIATSAPGSARPKYENPY